MFLVSLEGASRQSREQDRAGVGLPPGRGGPGGPGTGVSSLRCSEAPPRKGDLQSRPGSQPGRRCHARRFCFGAGRCGGAGAHTQGTGAGEAGRGGPDCASAPAQRGLGAAVDVLRTGVPHCDCRPRRILASGKCRAASGFRLTFQSPAR